MQYELMNCPLCGRDLENVPIQNGTLAGYCPHCHTRVLVHLEQLQIYSEVEAYENRIQELEMALELQENENRNKSHREYIEFMKKRTRIILASACVCLLISFTLQLIYVFMEQLANGVLLTFVIVGYIATVWMFLVYSNYNDALAEAIQSPPSSQD